MRYLLLLAPFSMLLVTGCGKDDYEDHSQDPELYARDVKQVVLTHIRLASRSKEPGDEIAIIVDELEQTDRPRGSHGATFDEILTVAKELQAKCDDKGRPSDMGKYLTKLKQLAESLPGEVDLSEGEYDAQD